MIRRCLWRKAAGAQWPAEPMQGAATAWDHILVYVCSSAAHVLYAPPACQVVEALPLFSTIATHANKGERVQPISA